MKFGIVGFAAWILTLALSPSASAASLARLQTPSGSPVLINADNLARDNDVFVLTGNVQVVYDQQHLTCEKAIIRLQTQEIEAIGKVVMQSPTVYLEGDRAVVSYKDDTGTIYNGFMQSGAVVFEGKVIRKTGPEEYEANRAYYTACATCPPAWSFTGTRIKATVGGYARIRNSVLEIMHFPVFWLPYLVVPLKSERQTGLLIPSVDFSEGGTAFTLPYFWAISKSQDATFYLKNYSLRGQKVATNYRYMLTDKSYGDLNFGGIQDKKFLGELRESNPNQKPVNRWFVNYNHYFLDLPDGFTQTTKLNLASDLRYPKDFPDFLGGYGEPSLENRVTLSRNTESTHASLDTSYYVNLLKTNPLAGNTDAVHRFPELRYSVTDRKILDTPFLFRLDTNFVNFARDDLAFDDVNLDQTRNPPTPTLDPGRTGTGANGRGGRYDLNQDVLRAGQRLDVQPEVSLPLRLGPLDILSSGAFRRTQYNFALSETENDGLNTTPFRQYFQGRVSTRAAFSRVFGPDDVPRATRYKHIVQPEVVLSMIPWLEQSNHSFFGNPSSLPPFLRNEVLTETDFTSNRGIQFDYNDRLVNRNLATFVFDNKIIRKRWVGNNSEYLQILRLRLAQSYDFDEARKDTNPRYPWSTIVGLLDVRLDRFETSTEVKYYPYHNVASTSSRMRVNDLSGNYLQLTFSQQMKITQDLDDTDPGDAENVGIGAGFRTRYLVFGGSIENQPTDWEEFRFKVKSWSLDTNILPPGRCWGIRTSVSQEIGKSPTYRINFDYIFGGA